MFNWRSYASTPSELSVIRNRSGEFSVQKLVDALLFLKTFAGKLKVERSTRREPGSGFAKLKGCVDDATSGKLLVLRMLREEINLKNLYKKGKLEVLSTSLFFVLQHFFQLLETRSWESNLHQPPPVIVYFLLQWNTKTPDLV